MEIDFGRTTEDYSTHRAAFPDSLFDRLLEWGIGTRGQKIVDLGTGTGALARGFARRGCHVIGLDISSQMLREAERLAVLEGLEIEFRNGRAEASGLESGCAEAVVAGQCWHWFDGPAAAAEADRLLGPGGRLAVAHFDWLPLPGNVVAETEALILAHNPGWRMAGGTGMYPRWLADAAAAGFQHLETFTYDLNVAYSPVSWRGRIRASAGVGASMNPGHVDAFDRALSKMLAARFPGDVLQIPHRVFVMLGVRRPWVGRVSSEERDSG